ncbi:hypothetical protein PV10_02887 [Exophiala mesophila]|uniref:NmrA-like domain-containing protein n=1 Tax=Exophiala mesophila TaxID=212818 RepID=A0A0D2A895_EXOME|nr:uncharacterized protein PV10_02887 [Exophiala mesophila]KIV95208.1 hypothetical protein PV10_02887 [Exophiala mesophila]
MERHRVVVAGFTSRVAQLITASLLEHEGIEITGICRDKTKVPSLVSQNPNVTVVEAEYNDKARLGGALQGASVCVCCYFGPEDLMLHGQMILIDSCIAENVPRYIASDFSFDYRGLKHGDFPFKDSQLEIHDYLARRERQGRITAVHVLNGGFFEAVLFPFMGALDVTARKIRYWGTGDEPWDMTSMQDTARFAAKVILDQQATGVLNVRGARKSLREIAGVLEHVYGSKFTLENLGTIQDLHEKMSSAREAFPDDVGQWLGLHYNYFTINGSTLLRGYDNDRYPDVRVQSLETFCRQHSLEQLPTLFR